MSSGKRLTSLSSSDSDSKIMSVTKERNSTANIRVGKSNRNAIMCLDLEDDVEEAADEIDVVETQAESFELELNSGMKPVTLVWTLTADVEVKQRGINSEVCCCCCCSDT